MFWHIQSNAQHDNFHALLTPIIARQDQSCLTWVSRLKDSIDWVAVDVRTWPEYVTTPCDPGSRSRSRAPSWVAVIKETVKEKLQLRYRVTQWTGNVGRLRKVCLCQTATTVALLPFQMFCTFSSHLSNKYNYSRYCCKILICVQNKTFNTLVGIKIFQ